MSTLTNNKVSTIYRVENNQGKGPYALYDYEKWTDKNKDHSDRSHPGPDRDSKLKKKWESLFWSNQHNYYFGFKSLKDLRAWFSPSERKRLRSRGFFVSKIHIPEEDVIIGSKQVAFYKRRTIKKTKMKNF